MEEHNPHAPGTPEHGDWNMLREEDEHEIRIRRAEETAAKGWTSVEGGTVEELPHGLDAFLRSVARANGQIIHRAH